MPAKSGKQYRFMQLVAHGGKSHGIGPSPEVAKEFIDKTPAKKRSLFSKKRKISSKMHLQKMNG